METYFFPQVFGVKMKQNKWHFDGLYTSWNPIMEDEHGLRWLVEYQRLDMILARSTPLLQGICGAKEANRIIIPQR